MANFHRRDSFLKNAGTFENFLDLNALPKMPKSLYDEEYTLSSADHKRPDLLAYKIYNNTRLWWVFALRNPDVLVDPINDFVEGTVIQLPSGDTVKRIAGL
jgi:hypothetical protein